MPADRPPLLHLLVPFSLPPAADARAALADFACASACAAFRQLVARATLVETTTGDAFQRALPHERWIARQFGLASAGETLADDVPLAPYMLLADGGTPGDARWACVQPVHVQVALDHLLLIDPASLALSGAEAATLYAVARPLIEALGVRVQAPTPYRWYLSGDALGALAGASPLRASGRSIEIWLPHETLTGQRSRMWMKLQNEVQMAWFEHPVNEAREARGLPAVNSVWLHAQGAMQPVGSAYTHVLSDAVATRGLALAAGGAPSAAVTARVGAVDSITVRADAAAVGSIMARGDVAAVASATDFVADFTVGSASGFASDLASGSASGLASGSAPNPVAAHACAMAGDTFAAARLATPVDTFTTTTARPAAPVVAMAATATHAAPRVASLPAPASFSALFPALLSVPCAASGNTSRDRAALVELDPFTPSFLEQDWSRWRAAFAALERDWFAPALSALQTGDIRELGLTLCGDTGSVTLRITRGDLRKFWRRRAFASLCVE